MPIVKVNPQSGIKKIFKVVLLLSFVVVFGRGVAAGQFRPQSRPTPTPPPQPINGTSRDDERGPLTTFEEEMRAKRLIKMAEKEHEENLKRAKEIAEIGKELQVNLKDKSVLDRDSLKKVERLEKLTKKVRSEAGGEDEDITIADRPADLCATVTQIAEASESLSKNVQDTPRQVVSASVIGKANVLLELIKMVRGFVGKP